MKNPKKNSWIVIVPVAAAVAAYVYWIYLPGAKAVAEVRDQIREKQDLILDSEKSVQKLTAGKQELAKTAAYVTACRHRAVDEKDLGNLFSMIHLAASQAKIRITRFDPQPTVAYDGLRRAPVTLGLTGSFRQVHEFLRSLEDMPAYVWVTSLKLELDVKTGKDVVGEVSLVIFIGNSDNSGYAVCSE